MKEKEEDIEQILLNNASIDDLIKAKMEKEFKEAIAKSKQEVKKIVITDISKVPEHLIFSKQSVFKLFNKTTKTETSINGIQAEALLGLQNSAREKMLKGKISAFATDDAYVKFEKVTTDGTV